MNDKTSKRGGFYFYEGKPYVSVTSVLKVIDKPALRYWFGREVYRAVIKDPSVSEAEAMAAPYKVSDTAKVRGSGVHSIIEAWKNIDEVVGQGGPYAEYAKAFDKFLHDHKVEIVEHEKTVYNHKECYAGTLDMLAKINGAALPTLIDVKTGKDIYPEVHLQLSAYRKALEEGGYTLSGQTVHSVEGTAALLLMEDGTYKYEIGKDKFKSFLAAKTLWEGMNEDLLEEIFNKSKVEEICEEVEK